MRRSSLEKREPARGGEGGIRHTTGPDDYLQRAKQSFDSKSAGGHLPPDLGGGFAADRRFQVKQNASGPAQHLQPRLIPQLRLIPQRRLSCEITSDGKHEIMPARRPWWLRGVTARGRFVQGGLYLVAGLFFLSRALLAHRSQWTWLPWPWLFYSVVSFGLGVARWRWERSHPDSGAR